MNRSEFKACSRSIINAVRKQPPSRAPKFIITLFGDTIEPHGGVIWLGSLIDLLAPFGINERLVRTSVYRLTQDDWLSYEKVGRRSYYRLTSQAAASVKQADKRIYYFPQKPWDNEWCLVFTGTAGISPELRAELRKRLSWLGFGMIAPNVYGHPSAVLNPIWDMCEELKIKDKIVVMRARNFDQEHGLSSHEMVRQCFKLNDLEKEYQAFIKRFQRITTCLESSAGELESANPEHCFIIRSMLIHEYRRILLRDPLLPTTLLPENWVGTQAYNTCATIYRSIAPIAEQHIIDVCEDQTGPFKPMDARFAQRFEF
ncbi:MAG: phenylacetic acid degradation operon negative regulatory protein PaaX [Chromatiales bacterium]|nr:phenylacetic acid degradation operon negative regulatory protein PaaX [Chromatiales bacterium]